MKSGKVDKSFHKQIIVQDDQRTQCGQDVDFKTDLTNQSGTENRQEIVDESIGTSGPNPIGRRKDIASILSRLFSIIEQEFFDLFVRDLFLSQFLEFVLHFGDPFGFSSILVIIIIIVVVVVVVVLLFVIALVVVAK